jgi:hypothetical protein
VSKRLAAGCALALGAGAVMLAALAMVDSFASGLAALGCISFSLGCGWNGLVRRGIERAVGLGAAALLVVRAVLLRLDAHA